MANINGHCRSGLQSVGRRTHTGTVRPPGVGTDNSFKTSPTVGGGPSAGPGPSRRISRRSCIVARSTFSAQGAASSSAFARANSEALSGHKKERTICGSSFGSVIVMASPVRYGRWGRLGLGLPELWAQKNATPEGVTLIEKSATTYLKIASASATVLETRETIW